MSLLSSIKYRWNYFRTRFRFKTMHVKHGKFITAGVPFVKISKTKGGSIMIGDNLRINNGMSANQIGFGSTPCTFMAVGGDIIIGNNVGMSQATLYALDANITIGDHTLLGGGTKIFTSDFHPINYNYRRDKILNEKYKESKNVVLGNDCFIGSGTIILKGVEIGDRTVIGAGSVVTKSIPPGCIAAGNPCRVIKKIEI